MSNMIIDGALNYLGDKLFLIKTYTYDYTIVAGGEANCTGNIFGASTPTGYTPLAFKYIGTGHVNVIPRNMIAASTGSSTIVSLRNIGTSSASATVQVQIIYVKSGIL